MTRIPSSGLPLPTGATRRGRRTRFGCKVKVDEGCRVNQWSAVGGRHLANVSCARCGDHVRDRGDFAGRDRDAGQQFQGLGRRSGGCPPRNAFIHFVDMCNPVGHERKTRIFGKLSKSHQVGDALPVLVGRRADDDAPVGCGIAVPRGNQRVPAAFAKIRPGDRIAVL